MKTIIRSKTLGYCSGVKSAVLKAEETLKSGQKLYALGQLIHNKIELDRLNKLGLITLNDNIDPPSGSLALIRAHGISPKYRMELESKKIKLLDATCPLVVKNQKLALAKSHENYLVIIAGKETHAEIRALLGFTSHAIIINTIEEANKLDLSTYNKIVFIAQTTFEVSLYKDIVDVLKQKHNNVETPTSICPATMQRQKALEDLAMQCEAIVIVGDSHSANTMGLVNRARGLNMPTFLVEDADNISDELKNYSIIGLSAGASAPNYLIDAIEEKLKKL